ncbi:MAG: hypothetical protein ACO4B5_12585, partial [Steroidobacteraceae bacterium]
VRGEMMRQAIADEAARLIVEHGLSDFHAAKRKAAARFGVTDKAVLPGNVEIEAAIASHHRLFGADDHSQTLQRLREQAIEAMRWLAGFNPRLVGPVLSGHASDHSGITLHLFAESPEAVALRLLDLGIRYQSVQRRMRWGHGDPKALPAFLFGVDEADFEAVVFPVDGIREAPASPVDGRPMKRAAQSEVEGLLTSA